MKLYNLKIEGFRRHRETNVIFSDASFLIGENNTGKSSIMKAVELLLTDESKIPEVSFFSYMDEDTMNVCEKVVLTGEFRDVPDEASNWRGFKGRIFPYDEDDTEGNKVTKKAVFYRKTFVQGSPRKIEMKSRVKEIKEKYKNVNSIDDFISQGFPEEVLENTDFQNEDRKKKMTTALRKKFFECFEEETDLFDYFDEEEWVENPGGIAGNVMSKLPRVLYIPAHDGSDNLGASKGTFQEILNELFQNVRKESTNYQQAQLYLDKLARELDPEDTETEFGVMMGELNGILDGVFSGIGLRARAELNNADSAIKPTFSISMVSNIPTPVEMQGTGVVRSTVFALLRYKAIRDAKKNSSDRPLIICFEEPEIYLHPNAANQMRDMIYSLATTKNNQIICSTHSPYMIDLSKKTGQVLNYLYTSFVEITENESDKVSCQIVCNSPFNIQHAFRSLQDNDKDHLKLVLKMDDYLSRIFFAKNVLIIEGDTEEIVLKETISIIPEAIKKNILNNWQIIRARGKATIISLIKYLKAMGITPYVMHDLDSETPGAAVMNKPIKEALDCDSNLFTLENCIEDVLGYPSPSNEKPYRALRFIETNWKGEYSNISKEWRTVVETIFETNH